MNFNLESEIKLAAAIKNDAVEVSEGIVRFNGLKLLLLDILIDKSLVFILAPRLLSIISEWFLDNIGSVIVVVPAAPNPENKRDDLICALAIGE